MIRTPLRLVSPPRERAASEPPTVDPAEVDEERVVDALRAGRAWAERALVETHTPLVRRLLGRILGSVPEIDDLCQEVFLRSIDKIRDLRDGVELRSWVTSFAVFVAREALRRRARRRWLLFFAPEDLPEEPDNHPEEDAASDARRALRATYAVLDAMDADLRTAFALRHIDGMELADVASACGVSLATIKRRLNKAEASFAARARRDAVLRTWTEEGGRW
jgi:RNA polymerase sigma-70 factor, ECF subfamily